MEADHRRGGVASIWYTMKIQDYPMTMKEYGKYVNVLLARNERRTSLYKLIAKATEIVPSPDKMFTAADYVNRFAARLKREPDFVSTVAIFSNVNPKEHSRGSFKVLPRDSGQNDALEFAAPPFKFLKPRLITILG
jgi:hypothetical protein